MCRCSEAFRTLPACVGQLLPGYVTDRQIIADKVVSLGSCNAIQRPGARSMCVLSVEGL